MNSDCNWAFSNSNKVKESFSSTTFSGFSCLKITNSSVNTTWFSGFTCFKIVNLSAFEGWVIHSLFSYSNSIESIYSTIMSGLSLFNISIWSTIWISFSNLISASNSNESIYSVCNTSLSFPWILIESLSSTLLSGLSSLFNWIVSIELILLSGLIKDNNSMESISCWIHLFILFFNTTFWSTNIVK